MLLLCGFGSEAPDFLCFFKKRESVFLFCGRFKIGINLSIIMGIVFDLHLTREVAFSIENDGGRDILKIYNWYKSVAFFLFYVTFFAQRK